MSNFLPMGNITGIGSLPHKNARQAVQFVLKHSAEIPFVPELPRRSVHEESIARVLAPVDDLLIRYDAAHYEIQPQQLDAFLNRLESAHADIPPSHCMAFGEWEQALARGDFEQARALKTQLVGLITLAFAIRYQGKAFAYDLMLTEALGRYLYRLARWQIERLEQWGLPVILFFDEPCLVFTKQFPESQRVIHIFRFIIQALMQTGALIGVHTCALHALPSLLALQPKIISFDAYTELEDFLSLEAAKNFVQDGGLVALGLIPTQKELQDFSPMNQFLRLVLADLGNNFLQKLAQQSFITATCGLGSLDMRNSKIIFEQSQELAHYLQQTAQAVDL